VTFFLDARLLSQAIGIGFRCGVMDQKQWRFVKPVAASPAKQIMPDPPATRSGS